MWNKALMGNFFKSFLLGLTKCSFWLEDCVLRYQSMAFRHFPDIS